MYDLIVEGLGKTFGGVRAINNVGFTVAAGKLTTLLGPSGCGKTTTLNCIAGLEHPDEGVIRVGDFVMTDMANRRVLPPEQRQIGMVFQSYALWPHMSVFDNVAFSLRLQKVAAAEVKRRVLESLALVGLEGLEQRYPFQLSGGQQQRVALARAVATQPRLLLLDEPLSNLDAQVREHARVWLRELQQRVGITTIYVTHDQSEAFAMSDMIAVMSGGNLLQYAPPQEVYEHPTTQFVAEFIGATSFVKGIVDERQAGNVRVRLPNGDLLNVQETRRRASSQSVPSRIAESESDRWQPNQPVVVGIRSERIALSGVGQAAGNVIHVNVVTSTFLGSKWQHVIDTGAGTLKVETLDALHDSHLSLYLPPDAILLFPEKKTA